MEEIASPTSVESRDTSESPSDPSRPGADAAPDIRLQGLTKRYGEVVAVDSVDLEIARGEFFTMLGPSGSGKTTTPVSYTHLTLPTTPYV